MEAAVRALITDVHLRSTLAGVRGLGTGGHEIVGMGPRPLSAGMWSRFVPHRATAPDVLDDPDGFTAAVVATAERFGPCLVYPGREESLDALLARPLPASARLPYAGRASLRLRDKTVLAEAAPAAGLRAPRTLDRGTARELRARRPGPACVVKSPWPGQEPRTARIVHDRAELDELLVALPPDQDLVLQEHVAGPLISVAVVIAQDGRLAARFQQRISHTWPARGGTTRRAESISPDALVDRVADLLRSVGFWGLAQVDIIAGPDGPVVLDVNPRFYDSLPLALAAGVNLPDAWHRVAQGQAPAPLADYKLGVRFRWLEAELLAIRHRAPRPQERHGGAQVASAVWHRTDPVPSALAATAFASSGAQRVARRLRGR